ncbi:MAG: T9SS type A sorting domain-containing protein [Bacteroidota bacterium]
MILSIRNCITSFMLLFSIYTNAQPLSGNYTINSAMATGGSNFQTFTDLSGDLTADGISGNVVVTVVPGSGPYTEQITILSIPGSGPNATVLLDGSGETLTALTNTNDRHVLRLSDVQYFTIHNLHIVRDTAATSGFYGIHILGSGQHITISNCAVDMSGSTSTLVGAYIASGSMTSILDSGDFHFINIVNDTAVGGGYGASIFGKVNQLATDIVISGNTFYDFHSNGVYLRETNGAIISNNFFDKRTAQVTSCNAIQIAQAANINANIFNNSIRLSQTNNGTMSFRGIYLFNGTGHKVYNNLIYGIRLTSGNFTGIEVRTGGTAPEIYFNTISIDDLSSTSGDLFGISEELSNTNAVLRNNIISITQQTSGTKAGLVLGAIATVTSAFNSNYNIVYVPGGNVALKDASTPVYYPTLSDWQAASTQDANSTFIDPVFTGLIIPIPTNTLADNLGTPIAGITTDVAGFTRGTPPDCGAYEFPSTIGIENPETLETPVLYPNPFSDRLNIILNNNQPSQMILYNGISGKQLRSRFSNAAYIDTKGLPAGVYFYEVLDGNSTVAKGKIIKQ